MSGTIAPETNPLSAAELVDVRRHCGFPAYGAGAADGTANRWTAIYVNFEYRITSLSDPELAVVRTFLANLNTLEAAIVTAASSIGISSAASYVHNADEVRDRTRLYEDWRVRLADFVGGGRGPTLRGNGLRLVA